MNALGNTNGEKPEWLSPWNTTTLEQLRMWPTWWNEELEAKMKEDLLVGIVTTGYEERKVKDRKNHEFTVSISLCPYHRNQTLAMSDNEFFQLDTAFSVLCITD